MSRQTVLIVNADDFGISERDNRIIADGLRDGVLTSTTLMANMPAFEAACALTEAQRWQGRVGLHFNLTYGLPLTDDIKRQARFCDADGAFRRRLSSMTLSLTRDETSAVERELRAQWQRCRDHGVLPSHIDSHQHIHNVWPIGMIVARWARAQNVRIRPARNMGPRIHPAKRLFKGAFNSRLRSLGVAGGDWAGKPSDLIVGRPAPGGVIEIIAHPVRTEAGVYSDETLTGVALADLLASCFPGCARRSYGELAGGAG